MKKISKIVLLFLCGICLLTSVAQAQTYTNPEVSQISEFFKGYGQVLSQDKSISDARYTKLLTNIDAYCNLYDAYLTMYKAALVALPNKDEPIGPQEVAKLDKILEATPGVGINNYKFTQKFDELIAFLKINITPILNDGIVRGASKLQTFKMSDITAESFGTLYEKTKTNLDKYDLVLAKHLQKAKTKIANHSDQAKSFFKTENYGVEFNDEPSSKVFYLKDQIASLMILNKEVYQAIIEQGAVKIASTKELAELKETFDGDPTLQAESYLALKEINDATEIKTKIYTKMANGPWANFFSAESAGGSVTSVADIMGITLVKDLIMGVVAGTTNGEIALPSFKEKYYVKDIHGNKVNMKWDNFFRTMGRHYADPGMYLNLLSFGVSAQAINIGTQQLFQGLENLCSRSLFKFGTKLTGGITGFGVSMGLGSYVGSIFGVAWETKSLLASGDPVLMAVAGETFQNELATPQALKEKLASVVISFGISEAVYAFINFSVDVFKGKVVILPKTYTRPGLDKLNDKGYCDPKDLNSWLHNYLNNSELSPKVKFFSRAWWKAFFKRMLLKGLPVFTMQEIIDDYWVSHWSWIEEGRDSHEKQRYNTFVKGADRYLTLFTYDIFRSQSLVNLRSIVDKYRGNTYIGYYIDKMTENVADYDKTLNLFGIVRSLYRNIVSTEVSADISDADLDAKLKTNEDIKLLVSIVKCIFLEKKSVEIEKALLDLNGKYGTTANNKTIMGIALDNVTKGTTKPEDEETKNQDQMKTILADPSSKLGEFAYAVDSKKEKVDFEILIAKAAAQGNLSLLTSKQTVSHYLYTLSLIDAKTASAYSEDLLTRLNAKLPIAATGTYADHLSAMKFMLEEVCPELYGIDHTEKLNVNDLSTVQVLFRRQILLPLATKLYLEMKTYKDTDADADLKALFSGIIKDRDTYGGMSTIDAIGYIYVKAGIPNPPEIQIEK